MDFKTHCDQIGVQLLYEDIKYIKAQLQKIPSVSHRTVLERYAEIWCKVMCECEDEIKGMNLGRRCANQYLRECIK